MISARTLFYRSISHAETLALTFKGVVRVKPSISPAPVLIERHAKMRRLSDARHGEYRSSAAVYAWQPQHGASGRQP